VVLATVTLPLAKPSPKYEINPINGDIREGYMDQRVREFFLTYEKANSSSDISAIGGLYADTFMFGGPNGVQAVKKEDFLKIVPKMKEHFSSMGISETQLQAAEASPLDSKYLLATVVWRIKLRNSFGSKHVDASASYVLKRGQQDALSIVFQIDHQDLASVINGQKLPQP
jgi:ketosteroid isomerase-like protein